MIKKTTGKNSATQRRRSTPPDLKREYEIRLLEDKRKKLMKDLMILKYELEKVDTEITCIYRKIEEQPTCRIPFK